MAMGTQDGHGNTLRTGDGHKIIGKELTDFQMSYKTSHSVVILLEKLTSH